MSRFDLREQARRFADELSELLNRTVCNGVRVNAVLKESGVAHVGYMISTIDHVTRQGIPVTLGQKPPSCYLGLSYRLEPDQEGQYLAVASSFLGLFRKPDLDETLLHYDYERDKGDGYPEAHLQINAASDHWTAACEAAGLHDRPLARLHLPVGGRRYRPAVEDIVEFLVTEGLVDGHPGWTQHVDRGREEFQRRQMRAAVRRDPQPAIELLRELKLIGPAGTPGG